MLISLLDRSRTRVGVSDAAAIATTVERAVRAESLGFHRFWTAEHHAVPGIASAAPSVLLAAIGARTSRIRLGTGGVMVPNHSPLVIAEQAQVLAALSPGRIDLGLGGSLGFTAPVRNALGRSSLADGEYAEAIEQVRAYLHGTAEITSRPQVPAPPLFLLAVKDGLGLAAELGLPVVVGGPLLNDTAAIDDYVARFAPSATVAEPYLIMSTDVVVAETAERARELALSEAWAHAESRTVGEFRALQPSTTVCRLLADASDRTVAAVERSINFAVVGTPEQVSRSLTQLQQRTGAAELLASVSVFDLDQVRRTDEFLASLQT